MESQQVEMDDSGCVQDESLTSKRQCEERGLLDLSDDVLLHVLQYCNACDLKALGFTCPRFGALVLDRSLWKRVDARRAACGRARFRWLVERGLHEGTVTLLLRGCALEARGCQGHRDSERSEKPSPQKYTSFAVPKSQEGAAWSAPAPAHPVRQPAQFYIRASSSRQLPRNMSHPYWPDRRDVLPHAAHAQPHASAAHCLGAQLAFTRRSLRRLLDKCPNLTTLSLDYGVVDARTTDLSHFPRTLTSLSLKGTKCYNLTTNKTMLFRINDYLPDLEHIDVSECGWLEPSALLPLSKLPKLRSLYARDCLRLSEFVAYASLATVRGFPALETLDLTGSPLGDTEAASFGWLRRLAALTLGAGGRRGAVPAHHHYRAEPFADDDGLEDWEREEPPWYKSGPDELDSDPEPEPDAVPAPPAEDTHVFTITFDRENGPRVQHDVLHGNVLGIGHRASNAEVNENAVPGNENAVIGNENAVPGNENAVPGNENAVIGNENAVPGNKNAVAGNENAVAANENAVPGNEHAVAGNENPVASSDKKVNVARDNDATIETVNKSDVTIRKVLKNDEGSNDNAVNLVPKKYDSINQSNDASNAVGEEKSIANDSELYKSIDNVKNYEPANSYGNDPHDTNMPNNVTNDEIDTNDKTNSILYDVREYEFDDDDDGFNNFVPSRESSINLDEPIAGPSGACHNIAQNNPKTDVNMDQNDENISNNDENNRKNESQNGEITTKDNNSKNLPGTSSETISRNIENVLKRPAEPEQEQSPKKPKVEMQKSVRFRRNLPPVVVMRDPNRPDVEIIQDLPMHELGLDPAENQPNPVENQLNQADNQPNPAENQPNPHENQPNPAEDQPNPAENQPNLAGNQPNPAENQPNPPENQPNQAGNGNDVVFYFNVGEGEQRNRAMRLPFIRNIVFAPPVPRAAPSSLITDNTILGYGVSDVLNVVRIGQNRLVLGIQDADKPNKSALKRLVCTGYSGITDLSLEHLLYAAPSLEYIDFSETNVTTEGVERFKLLRPNCKVVYSKFVQKQMYE